MICDAFLDCQLLSSQNCQKIIPLSTLWILPLEGFYAIWVRMVLCLKPRTNQIIQYLVSLLKKWTKVTEIWVKLSISRVSFLNSSIKTLTRKFQKKNWKPIVWGQFYFLQRTAVSRPVSNLFFSFKLTPIAIVKAYSAYLTLYTRVYCVCKAFSFTFFLAKGRETPNKKKLRWLAKTQSDCLSDGAEQMEHSLLDFQEPFSWQKK